MIVFPFTTFTIVQSQLFTQQCTELYIPSTIKVNLARLLFLDRSVCIKKLIKHKSEKNCKVYFLGSNQAKQLQLIVADREYSQFLQYLGYVTLLKSRSSNYRINAGILHKFSWTDTHGLKLDRSKLEVSRPRRTFKKLQGYMVFSRTSKKSL